MFGVSRPIVAQIWLMTHEKPQGTHVKHLLWALIFLKLYASESIHASLAGVDEKTFRKWSWVWIKTIATLEIVLSHVSILTLTY